MAPRLATLVLLAALVSGCFAGDGPRRDDGGDAPNAGDSSGDGADPASPDSPGDAVPTMAVPQWNATGCTSRIFEAKMPAALVREHLPERFELYEFPPGVSYVQTYVFDCMAADLGDGAAPAHVQQVLFTILYLGGSGRASFVVDWVASDPAAQAALAAHGFPAAPGGVTFEAGPPERAHVAGAQAKATISWVSEISEDDTPTTTRFVHDAAGTDVVFEAQTPGTFSSPTFVDGCVIEASDAGWLSVLKAAQRECLPFQAPPGDVVFRLRGAGPADA